MMDHSSHAMMDHSMMDHSDHTMPMCSMNMLFTWSSENLCIVFRSWRVTSSLSLLLSLLAIVALGAGYEALRAAARRHDAGLNIPTGQRAASPRPEEQERSSLLRPGSAVARQDKLVRALFYAAQVFYSFFIMLLFMTYNGWVMIAVAVGAFVGFLLFGEGPASKTAACH